MTVLPPFKLACIPAGSANAGDAAELDGRGAEELDALSDGALLVASRAGFSGSVRESWFNAIIRPVTAVMIAANPVRMPGMVCHQLRGLVSFDSGLSAIFLTLGLFRCRYG